MSLNLSGTPGVKQTISALGSIPQNVIKGIFCVQAITKRGEPGIQKLVTTWEQFLDIFGDVRTDDNSALILKQALSNGAKCRVTRAFHYTDPTDLTTVSGTKASIAFNNNAVSAAGASITLTIATWTGTGSSIQVIVPDPTNLANTISMGYTGTASQTAAAAMTAFASAINTLANGYVASVTSGVLKIALPSSTGVNGNGYIGQCNIVLGTISGAVLKFKNGVNAVSAITSTFTADAVGDGYNGATITISQNAINAANVDVVITIPDAINVQRFTTKRILALNDITSLNNQMYGVNISFTGSNYVLPLGTCTLAGGVQDITLIADADIIGSTISKSGNYAFDDVTDSMRIWNIVSTSNAVNAALVAYCAARQDMRARFYVPTGLTIGGIDDYRNGNGIYLYQPIDSFWGSMWFAETYIDDPNNSNNHLFTINPAGFQMANRAKADNEQGEWYSDSGNDYGKIVGVNGMRLNVGSPGNRGLWDGVYEDGVNAVINHPTMKAVSWGNRTCLRDTSSLLSKDNIADLVVLIARFTKQQAELMNFKPNDIQMFSQLYLKVAPWIRETLVAGRAIEGDSTPSKGEGKWWFWLGDQTAKDLNSLVINKKSDVDAGKYKARFAFKPKAANEYILIDLAPTDSTTIQNIQQLLSL